MTPLPAGLRIALDRRARRHGSALIGGSPRRILRLSAAGWKAVSALEQGMTAAEAARCLGRRLVEAGVAHPRPAARAVLDDVTVVIPVRDRSAHLGRCLSSVGGGVPLVVVDDGSLDPDAMADVVGRRGGRLVRRAHSGGPAAARNTGLAEVETDLVAFLDSDCTATEDWLRLLLGHFDDPVVAAVAPRVHPRRVRPAGALQRYLEGRSPIDLGPDEGPVVPGGHVSFVPTAALVVRRSALRAGFDEQLRFGEDVDLVWRLHEAGWRVRYDPTVTVLHDEPQGLRRVLSRRFRYGTSAAPLARRHPGRLTPAILHRWPTVLVVVASGGRPRSAAILALPYCAMLTRRAHRLGLSPAEGPRWFAESLVYTALSLARYLATFGTPVTLAAAWRWRRPSLLGLIALPAFVEWRERETELDPVRFTALALVDDAAYGAGVAWGCLRHRTLQPLLPRLR